MRPVNLRTCRRREKGSNRRPSLFSSSVRVVFSFFSTGMQEFRCVWWNRTELFYRHGISMVVVYSFRPRGLFLYEQGRGTEGGVGGRAIVYTVLTATAYTATRGKGFPASKISTSSMRARGSSVGTGRKTRVGTSGRTRVRTMAMANRHPVCGVEGSTLIAHVHGAPLTGRPALRSMLGRVPNVGRATSKALRMGKLKTPVVCLGSGGTASTRLSRLSIGLVSRVRLVAAPNTGCSTAAKTMLEVLAEEASRNVFNGVRIFSGLDRIGAGRRRLALN